MKWKLSKKIENKCKFKDINPIVNQLLFNRGLCDRGDIDKFLAPNANDLYDPFLLFDTKGAVARIEKAISEKEKIVIHGDYDVDGMSATAILWDYLYRKRGADVIPYIPSRVDEGYGLSEESMSNMKKFGAELIITVDCGIRDFELIDRESIDFIVVDHHQPGSEISKRAIIVHPMYPGHEYPCQKISGCAVTWKLICAIEKSRNPKNYDPLKIDGIDLVALSTVTDLMPLTDENRIIVSLGLEILKSKPSLGLDCLIGVAQIDRKSIDTYHLGFLIGPRLNAAGRIGDPMDGVRLLTTKKISFAEKISRKLSDLNQKRQEMTDEVMIQVKDKSTEDEYLFFAQNDNWSEGIIGLAAGKVLEEVYRPVIVVTGDGDIVRGSARSIVGFNITEAIENFSDILEKYGGHEQAAGFTIKRENLQKFEEGIKEFARKKLSSMNLERELLIDMELMISQLNWDLIEIVNSLKPFGTGNRRPLFLIKNVVVVSSQLMSEGKHVKFTIKGMGGDFISCIFFNCGKWGSDLRAGNTIDMVGVPEVNVWNGSENLQFNITDVKLSEDLK